MEVHGQWFQRHAVKVAVGGSRHHRVRADEAPQCRVVQRKAVLEQMVNRPNYSTHIDYEN
jgi:hypothetical protein